MRPLSFGQLSIRRVGYRQRSEVPRVALTASSRRSYEGFGRPFLVRESKRAAMRVSLLLVSTLLEITFILELIAASINKQCAATHSLLKTPELRSSIAF